MNWVNRIVAVGLIGACWILWPYTEKFPGSAAEFPRLVLIVIGVLSFLMFARTVVPSLASAAKGEGTQDVSKMLRPLSVFTATTIAVLAMRFIGFFPAVAGLGVALIGILGLRKPAVYVAAYVCLIVFVFMLFQLLLKVPLNSIKLWGG